MVICSKCKVGEGTLSNNWCKDCWREYRKNYRLKNIDRDRELAKINLSKRIAWLRKIKENIPCKDCGKIYEPCCMDYDHVPGRGEKFESITRMVINDMPETQILEEISKCDLVCALCHNTRTHNRNIACKRTIYIQRNIDIINKFKDKPCAICNKKYEPYNMQADHIDPNNKLYAISSLKGSKVETLLKELEKCQVLCVLCHRIKSLTEQKEGKYSNLVREKKIKKQYYYDKENGLLECASCGEIKHVLLFHSSLDTTTKFKKICKKCTKLKFTSTDDDYRFCNFCKNKKHISEFKIKLNGNIGCTCIECFRKYK